MTKGQKAALRHAANAIDGTTCSPSGVELGAHPYATSGASADRHNRPFASVYLATRAGRTPTSQANAQDVIQDHYGLTYEQAEKVDRVAASTHNIKQRAGRVARFLRRVLQDQTYVGIERAPTTGACAASL